MTATKASVKAAYIANLRAAYPFYTDGSRPLSLANLAADAALAGIQKIEGECWTKALRDNNLQKATTLKMLAALPDA